MNTRKHLLGTLSLLAAFGVGACSSDPAPTDAGNTDVGSADVDVIINADTGPADTGSTDTGTDTGPGQDTGVDAGPTDTGPVDSGPTDAGPGDSGVVINPLCMTYCTQMMTNCTGANVQYENMADCLDFCGRANWPTGAPGAMSGNSLNCRIYHGGAPAVADAAMHCPHAGPTGAGVCGSVNFRTEASSMFTRVDRMGMPAVSTALVGSARKNAYNDGRPVDDMMFAGDFITSLTGLHTALDRHLVAANLTPCSMTTMVGGLPECVGQNYAPGATVASLILPNDVLNINTTVAAGFPNGRRLQDPVIDVTLGVLLLRLGTGTCGAGMCSAATLASVPINPGMNDRAFLTTFPYLAPAHAP